MIALSELSSPVASDDLGIPESGVLQRQTSAGRKMQKQGKIRYQPLETIEAGDHRTDTAYLTQNATATAAVAVAAAATSPADQRSFKGLYLVAASAFFFSFMSTFVSLAADSSQPIGSFQMIFFRCIMQTSLSAFSCLFINKVNPWGERGFRLLLTGRGVVGIVSMSCLYYSVTAIGVADATVLFFVAPVYAGLIGKYVLNEPWDRIDNLLAMGSVAGCVLVARPSFLFDTDTTTVERPHRALGCAVAMCGAVLTASVFIFIRRIGKNAHAMVLVFYTGFSGLLWGPLGMLLFQQQWLPISSMTTQTTLYLFAIGGFAFCGQICFNAGVQLENAGLCSMVRNIDVVLVFLWQITLLNQRIAFWSIVGAAVMTFCVLAIGIKKLVLNARAVAAEAAAKAAAAVLPAGLDEDAGLDLVITKI